jgi:hypothetical protein
MKQIRKSLLTLLTLTLFGGAGAWAQTPTAPVIITAFDYSAIPEGGTLTSDNVTVTFVGDMRFLPTRGWTIAQGNGKSGTITVTAADGFAIDSCKFIYQTTSYTDTAAPFELYFSYTLGTILITYKQGDILSNTNLSGVTGIEVYLTALDESIELTKSGANQWTLGQTPDYDLELQVEYYEPHALKNIPAGWQVMVNGVDKSSAIAGDSLMITETDSVTLIPANPRRVKSVTLEDDAPAVQTITVAGLQLNYVEGENWVQTAQRNPGVITIESSYVNKMNGSYFLNAGSSVVSPTSTYDSSLGYWWQEW